MTERETVRQALYDAIKWQESLADANRNIPDEYNACMADAKTYRALLKKRYGTDKTRLDVLMESATLVSIHDLRKKT